MRTVYTMLLLFIMAAICAEGPLDRDRIVLDDPVAYFLVYKGKGYYYDRVNEKPRGLVAEFGKSDITVDPSGYYTVKVYSEYKIFLTGGGYEELYSREQMGSAEFNKHVNERREQAKEKEFALENYFTFPIIDIKTSSHLVEKTKSGTVEFNSENLLTVYNNGGCICHPRFWNYAALPWSEGEKGDGIGVTLDITFKEPVESFVILNGYVDLTQRHLFRENGRLKRVKISSLDQEKSFEIFYDFKDVVEFSRVVLPEKAGKVRVEIVEVYKGSKWSDTCISGILPDVTVDYKREEIKELVDGLLRSLQ